MWTPDRLLPRPTRGRLASLALAVASLALAANAAHADPPAPGSLAEAEACLERNLPKLSVSQRASFRIHDRTGKERSLVARVFWKRDRKQRNQALVRVESPPDVRGSAYLMLEREGGDETFTYLPELDRVRRIHPSSASGSMFGTDFSYEDFRHFQRVSEGATRERLADAEVDGVRVVVIQSIPGPQAESAYTRILTFLDAEHCVPLRMEFRGTNDEVVKELEADRSSIEESGGLKIARRVTMRDLANESRTELELDEIELDGDVSDRIFTVSHLERGR